MSKPADRAVRITASAHERLKEAAEWAGGLSLAAAASTAIGDYWRQERAKDKAKRKARRDGR